MPVNLETMRHRAGGPHAQKRAMLSESVPYLAAVRIPEAPTPDPGPQSFLRVATYNVHRWTGPRGGRKLDPALAMQVIEELDTDVIALQEALRPFEHEDPLIQLADRLRLHYAFVTTRLHRRGELGNAILSKRPIASAFAIDLSFGRLEQRAAIAAQFRTEDGLLSIVATHLALVDRTRAQQVRALLDHPQLQGPVVLMGDMNAWRKCKGTRKLNDELHHNQNWPPTYPVVRPVLALDRIYARDAHVDTLHVHSSQAARYGSDHLPLVAEVQLNGST